LADNLIYIPIVNFNHRLSKEYELGEGFSLVKFPKKFDVDYRTFGHSYFKRHYGDQFIKEAKDAYCLRYDWPGEGFRSIQEMIYKAEDPAITFLIALRVVQSCSAGFKMIFHTPSLKEKFPFDFAEYRMIGFQIRTSKAIHRFVEEDIFAAKEFFNKLLHLLKNEYKYRRIFNTLRYFDLGYRSANVDSRVIYFTIALEVLYKPSRGKITRVMAQRLSHFLGKDKKERDLLTEKTFEMMNFKARLTHGDMTYFDISRPERIQLVQEEEEVLRRTLQKILKNNDLIEMFSNLQSREEFFEGGIT
jgi:hypothetical protein